MLTVVKIGGNVIDNPEALERFLDDFARLEGPKILVHGGGAVANKILRGLGIEPHMIDGRRVTDGETLRIVTMAYAGWINKSIVAGLQARGCNAMGLSGADGDAIRAVRRAAKPVDYGFVGDPVAVNEPFVNALLDGGCVPVFCAITHDGAGQLLNTNADTVASTLAVAMRARLVYCFEKRGVLAGEKVVERLDEAGYAEMKARGEVYAGMIAKLDNVFKALRGGAAEVVVKHADDLLKEGTGTKCK
jgi:acetylglutamate kinase